MSKKPAVNIIRAAIDMIQICEHDSSSPTVKVAAFAVYSALMPTQRFLMESVKLNGRVGRIAIGGNVESTLSGLMAMGFVRKDEATGRYSLTRIASIIMGSAQIDPTRHVEWYTEDCKDVD